ncbi:hypothetical protein ACYCS5_09995 [Paenibacillus sp. SEL3]|nr:hypothetical protein [Paenibacillus polymyxa]WRL57967.1 hypothetical protein U3G77_06740 [Paenibacillus polymyxa]
MSEEVYENAYMQSKNKARIPVARLLKRAEVRALFTVTGPLA